MIVRPARPAQASIALCLFALVLAVLGCTEKLVEPPPPPHEEPRKTAVPGAAPRGARRTGVVKQSMPSP